jgi:hypothetical protein
VEEFIHVLFSALPGIASTAVIAVCGYAWHKLKDFRGEHSELVKHLEEYEKKRKEDAELRAMQEAQNFALREILGDALDKEHARLVEQGYASPDEKLKFERKYNAYHGLGGNGTRTALYEDVLEMKSYPN